MYKNEIIAKEISDYLDKCKSQGMESVTIIARQVEHDFAVSRRCGAKPGTRYPLICQAMHKVSRYKGVTHPGPDPSSTLTITYNLRKRNFFGL